MSYCRYSSDNCESDVFLYHSKGEGWHLHASNEKKSYSYLYKRLYFVKQRLLKLREEGLHVPQKALDRVEEELNGT